MIDLEKLHYYKNFIKIIVEHNNLKYYYDINLYL